MTQETKPTSNEVNRSSATHLTEPVQVGMWYETRAGAIVKVTKFNGNEKYPYSGNCGDDYTEKGEIFDWKEDQNDLIRCLGADPFKQPPVAESATTEKALYQQIFTAALQRSEKVKTGWEVEDTASSRVIEAMQVANEAIKQLKKKGMV